MITTPKVLNPGQLTLNAQTPKVLNLISSHLMEEDDQVEFKIIVQDISYVSPRLRTVPRTV